MTNGEQRLFIRREIFSMTLSASTQRAGVYREKTLEGKRKPFQKSLRLLLEEKSEDYSVSVSDAAHLENIEHISRELSARHADVLTNNGMRIGPAQKALNLYLKYLWCLGEIPEPPHCPIDATVLSRVPGCAGVHWTMMKTIEEYRVVIEKARAVATQKRLSLPEWELRLFNEEVAGR